jgi:hypothetical protein
VSSIPLPALAIQPPENPINQVQKLMAIKSLMGQQQMQQQDIALKQQQVQDQKTVMGYLQQNPGSTFGDAADALKGKVSLPAYTNLVDTDATIRQKHAAATDAELKNFQGVHDAQQKIYNNAANLSDEDLAKQWPDIAQQFNSIPGNNTKVDPNQPPTSQQLQQHGTALGLQETYLKQEADKRKETAETTEATQKGEEAAQGAAAKKQEALWYQQHPQAGAPGVPNETASAADWLAKPENKGKTLSDYNIAMKKIVPAYNFQLQNTGAAADQNGNPSEIAKAIASGSMGWKDAVSMRTPMATKNAILQQVFKINPNFDTAEFGLEQDAAKKARSGAWADTRLAYNTALDHSDLLLKASDALGNNDFRTLNSLSNRFKTEFGWSGQINYNAIANAYNHEVGSVVSKGHITDKEVEAGNATLPDNANPQTIHDVVNSYKSLMTSKRDELDKIVKAGAGSKANATIATGSSSEQGGGAQPQQSVGHKAGDVIVQNGHQFTVDAVDKNGKVTAAH